jgi:hypothetical protein
MGDHLSRLIVTDQLKRPTRNSMAASCCPTRGSSLLHGLAPSGGCLAVALLRTPVVSCATFSPLLPKERLFSVARSERFPFPGVTRRCALWSADFPRPIRRWIAIPCPTWQIHNNRNVPRRQSRIYLRNCSTLLHKKKATFLR